MPWCLPLASAKTAPTLWQAACAHWPGLNLQLDPGRSQRSKADQDISQAESPVRIWVIHTQEEWAIAQDCAKILKKK
jgi:acetate kinase